ncbi:MAG: hypothetical protein K2J40_04985 [Ruminococcus sp.]|nr:hypothetical protein [Ruminococcus sp.]
MNNFKKKIIALVALTCVALSTFAGCSDKNDESDTSNSKPKKGESTKASEEIMIAQPFAWGSEEDGKITIDGIDINSSDPVKADHVDPTKASETSEADKEEDTTAYVAGEPITEIVNVTEANGEAVTEANGEPVTEVKTITNATPEPTTANGAETPAETQAASEYVSNTKGMYAMWIDISKNEDFVFNDSVIKITFKVKDTAPDGVYDIAISPDLSSVAGQIVDPDTIVNGSIKVGDGAADVVDPSSMNGFAIYGDHVSAKQGDTFDFSINMKDNPGLAGLFIWYYYDSNALEVINCVPDGEFAEVSKNSTQTG